ncbi:MAG: very short patch repair endonuclease [Verrucomicrobia bacterium]|nr:MAG: very short patch repair endonuclease [Verrucomicrobiota bacterium]
MADVFTAAKRSEVMSRIRSHGNRDTELRMIALLRDHRITDWRRGTNLPGKPDFVFRSARVAVFVDGCFWHGCRCHGHTPRSNQRYWVAKLARNKARDRAINRELRTRGWAVLRVWECALTRKRQAATLRRLAAALMKRNGTGSHKRQRFAG